MRARWLLLVSLLVSACIAAPREGADRAVEFDRAELVLDAVPEPPGDAAAWEEVSLPDRWRERRPDAGGLAWYRLVVPGPVARRETWAVYLPHVNMNAAVWVNGAPVGSGGRFTEPVAHNFNRPLYFTFPGSLLARSRNEVHVRLLAYAHHYGELGPVWIGPDAALRPAYEASLWQRTSLAQLATVVCAIVVLLAGGLWLASRREPAYGWLALMTVLWGIVSFNYWLRDIPVEHWTWERIIHPAMDGFLIAMAVWAHRHVGVSRPRLESVFAALACASLLVAWLLPVEHFYPAVNLMHGLTSPAVGYAAVLVLLHARRSRPAEAAIYAAAGAVGLAFALHDLLVQFGGTDPGAPFLLPYIVPLLLLSFGSTLVVRFAAGLRSAEALNRELEQRVVQKHGELERSYEDRRGLERAKLLSEERERLVREMHDGLGGQLVSLLSLVEADTNADPHVSSAIRTALDDMRLVIDSLDPALQTLAGALGAARARLEPVLVRGGVGLEWRASSLPATPWLGPQDYLDVLRILQEALVNAVRHAGATRIVVRTGERDGEDGRAGLFIEIRDNGRGIDPARIGRPGSRGLRNMRQRAARLSGLLRVGTADPENGVGTCVELWLAALPPPSGVSPPA